MKRLLFVIGFMLIYGIAYSATAPTEFTMTAPSKFYSPAQAIKCTFKVQVAASSGYDSLIIVNDGNDSLVTVAAIDLATLTFGVGQLNTVYVTGLNEATSYAWQIRVLKGATNTTSNEDTLSTLAIPLNNYGTTSNDIDALKLMRWDSWPAYNIKNTTFTLIGETDSDSTIYYPPWKYGNVNIEVSCDADSVNSTILWYAGVYGAISDAPLMAFVDSLNITAAGFYNTGTLGIPKNSAAKFKIRNNTGAGGVSNPQTYKLWLNLNKD
jgi:hypothetical protein